MEQINPQLGFFHIPKTAGLYLSSNIQNALKIPEISIHTVFGNDHNDPDLAEIPVIGKQFLYLSEAGWTDIVLRSYPFYTGHLSINELLALWRKNVFTYLSDPIKRALSLYRYGVTHDQYEFNFLDWLNNFHLSIPRQFYGDQQLQTLDMQSFEDEFFERITYVYAASNPHDVLTFLTRDFGLQFNAEFGSKHKNEFQEILPVGKVAIAKRELFEILHDVTWVDRQLIQAVEKRNPQNYFPTKTDYTYEEYIELIKKYDYIELI